MMPPTIAGYQGADYTLTKADLVRRNLSATEKIEQFLAPPVPKPRMRLKDRIWGCVSWDKTIGPTSFCAGYGYTVREAYEDWRRRVTLRKPHG